MIKFPIFVAKCHAQNVCNIHSTEMVKQDCCKCEVKAGEMKEDYQISLIPKNVFECSHNSNAQLLPRIHFDPLFSVKMCSCSHVPIFKNEKFPCSPKPLGGPSNW